MTPQGLDGADEAGGELPRLCVLKFGSSVLEREEDYPKVALEIYRHVRQGEKVVAVVSALAGQTDALLTQAQRVGGDVAPDALVARLSRVGELHSAALMALALSKAGLRSCTPAAVAGCDDFCTRQRRPVSASSSAVDDQRRVHGRFQSCEANWRC